MRRTRIQKIKDTITFPLRAFLLFHEDRFGLSCQATERYDYAASAVIGYCLDIGCGSNRFINETLNGSGVGADVYRYAENTNGVILDDPTKFPWKDASFDSVTFLANLSHIPAPIRDAELGEAFRVIRPGGNIIISMGLPIVEVVVHGVIWFYDQVFKTKLDHDNERGMAEGEEFYMTNAEIRRLLTRTGFRRIVYKPFWTQWCMNGMYIGWKD